MKRKTIIDLLAIVIIVAGVAALTIGALPALTAYALSAWGIYIPWGILARTWTGIVGIYASWRIIRSIL